MLDNEELTTKIMVEEEYEISVIMSFLQGNNHTNSSVLHSFDAEIVDILHQAASHAALVRRLFFLVVNPSVVLLGLLFSAYALWCVSGSVAYSVADGVNHRRALQLRSLIHYYFGCYLTNSIVYLLLICTLSWLYFVVTGEHVTTSHDFACRAWQLLVHLFHDLSIWILVPPFYAVWCFTKNGYNTLLYGNIPSNATEQAKSLTILMSDSDEEAGPQRKVDTLYATALKKPMAPLLGRVFMGLIVSFIVLLYTHSVWSHSLLEDKYLVLEGVKRCRTHMNTGFFFSKVWPLTRFILSNCVPVVGLLCASMVLFIRMRRLIAFMRVAPRHDVSQQLLVEIRATFAEWFSEYRADVALVTHLTFWTCVLRLQWCVATLYAGVHLLQPPANLITRHERGVNLMLTICQTLDHCAMILVAVLLIIFRGRTPPLRRIFSRNARKLKQYFCGSQSTKTVQVELVSRSEIDV